MPILKCLPTGKELNVQDGKNLMAAIQEGSLPIGSSCGAVAVCAKCFVKVVQGMENLSPPGKVEKNLLIREKLPADHRISCLAIIHGPVTVTTPYW